MSALEVVAPPRTVEKGVDATVVSVDTGVQALVRMSECSVQASPATADQGVSAIPGMNEASIDARPSSTETGVQSILTVLDASIDARPSSTETGVQSISTVLDVAIDARPSSTETGVQSTSTVTDVSIDARPSFTETGVQSSPTVLEEPSGIAEVRRTVGSSKIVPSKTLGSIAEGLEPEETPTGRTESAPKGSFPKRFAGASVRIFKFPLRLLLCSAKPVEDGMIPVEGTVPSNTTREK
jgi:hypothetical protein